MAKSSLPKNLSIDNLEFGDVPQNSRFHNLTGQTFHRLTVIGFKGRIKRQSHWYCRCECGSVSDVTAGALRSKKIRSCGCLAREIHAERCRTILAKHNGSYTPEYHSWSGARNRCNNPKNRQYHLYGGRGVAMCDRWDDFANFLADMGKRPGPAFSLDRINPNGNYEPTNCRWAVAIQQSTNRRSSVRITFEGKTTPLTILCRRMGLDYQKIYRRIFKFGWDVNRAFTLTKAEGRTITGQFEPGTNV